jgi:hypothetical protein
MSSNTERGLTSKVGVGAHPGPEVRNVLTPTEKPFWDHHGQRTTDPRCELGLCAECIEADFAAMRPVTVPSLSPLDPAFKTDGAYRARYFAALDAAGITRRPLDEDGDTRDPEAEDIIALAIAGDDDADQATFDLARRIVKRPREGRVPPRLRSITGARLDGGHQRAPEGTLDKEPRMFATAAAIVLWASQMTLSAQCQCPTEGIVETSSAGTYVGAIAASTEASQGVWIAADGSMTVEVR